jgi:hypothetical protein
LSSDELARPGYTDEGWSVKDMMAHVAAWSDHAARILRDIAAGTWDGRDEFEEPGSVDRKNAEWFERDRDLDVDTVRARWHSTRAEMLASFGVLEEITPDADEWFEESGPSHYAEHLPGLERWIERVRADR